MLRLVARRVPQMFIVVLGASFLTYAIMFLLPGNVIDSILGDNYSKEAAAQLTAQLHLDQPFFARYGNWLLDLVTGNVGDSFIPPRQDVWDLVGRALLPTVEMLIIAQITAIVLGVLLAVVAVMSRSKIVDRLIQAIALTCSSIPGFVLALLLLMLLGVSLHLVSPRGWVDPASGGWGQNLGHIAFPSIALGLFAFPMVMRVFRAELVEQFDNEDYVTMARLKGISSARVVFGHVLRNSSFGLLTVVGIGVSRLIAGVIVIEEIFAIPGMGSLIRTSVVQHDTPTALVSITLVVAAVVVISLVVDILYALVDPRVRSAKA